MGLARGGYIDVKVPRSTFRPRDFDYLVFGNFDPAAAALTPYVFAFRADTFAQVAKTEGAHLRFRGRPDPARAGKLRPYLYRVEEVAGLLEAGLAVRRARSGALPATRAELLRQL